MSTLTMNFLSKLNPYAVELNAMRQRFWRDDSSPSLPDNVSTKSQTNVAASESVQQQPVEEDTTVDLTPSSTDASSSKFTTFTVPSPGISTPSHSVFDVSLSSSKEGVAELIAEYGSSSATAWLEFERYKIWRPAPNQSVPDSSFTPVQGYLRADPYVFAWGNPLVSDPAALPDTCAAFIDWCTSEKLKCVWLCVDGQMEKVLGAEGSRFGWSTLSCIVEDVLDPRSVVALATGHGGGSEVKDLKKNLRRAEREHVTVREVQQDLWTDAMKHEVEQGILDWKNNRTGIQIASSSFQPWLDFAHRRYWIAEKDAHIIGVLILSPVHPTQYQIKNAVMFPTAPRGTSEELIFRAMQDLQDEDDTSRLSSSLESSSLEHHNGAGFWSREDLSSGSSLSSVDQAGKATPDQTTPVEGEHQLRPVSPPTSPTSAKFGRIDSVKRESQQINGNGNGKTHSRAASTDSGLSTNSDSTTGSQPRRGVTVTFGVSASDSLTPVDNLSGWKITWLSKTYNGVIGATGLTKRGDFRNKFHSEHQPMYVCYPVEDGFGLDGVNKLIKCLRQ